MSICEESLTEEDGEEDGQSCVERSLNGRSGGETEVFYFQTCVLLL
jgi:hypothetical protein